jgi:hypothetical protein
MSPIINELPLTSFNFSNQAARIVLSYFNQIHSPRGSDSFFFLILFHIFLLILLIKRLLKLKNYLFL